MFCWRGVTPNVIPDSILTPSHRIRIRRPRHAEETSTHDQPDPRPTPPRHRNHPRDRHLGIRPPRLARAALHLSLIHISEPTRQAEISYAVFCLKKKTHQTK